MQPQITCFNFHLPIEVRPVSETAKVLGVREIDLREIDLFKLAHRWWFQRETPETMLNKMSSDYLQNETTPSSVGHYCRNVLNLDSVGQLHPQDFGVDQQYKDYFSVNERRFTDLITLLAFPVYLLFI